MINSWYPLIQSQADREIWKSLCLAPDTSPNHNSKKWHLSPVPAPTSQDNFVFNFYSSFISHSMVIFQKKEWHKKKEWHILSLGKFLLSKQCWVKKCFPNTKLWQSAAPQSMAKWENWNHRTYVCQHKVTNYPFLGKDALLFWNNVSPVFLILKCPSFYEIMVIRDIF